MDIYIFWVGYEYKLIKELRNLIYKNTNRKVHLINYDNLYDYIPKEELPKCFFKLCIAHQADYIRVNVICKYGGIWLDSDTIYLKDFDIINDGFFVIENNEKLCNGVFASKAKTPLMLEWKQNIDIILKVKEEKLNWNDLGSKILLEIKYFFPEYFDSYKIYNGLENVYPVNWNYCVDEYIKKPYENYNNIIREFQPFIILVNSVYKDWENLTIEQQSNTPLNYFLKQYRIFH
jgi:hypothetical protein